MAEMDLDHRSGQILCVLGEKFIGHMTSDVFTETLCF